MGRKSRGAQTPGLRWMDIDEVALWDRNPRQNDSAVEPVAKSLIRFGFVSPVTLWAGGGRLVAGHTRLRAVRFLQENEPVFGEDGRTISSFQARKPDNPFHVISGYDVNGDAVQAPSSGAIPVRFQEFRSEAEANAYALADNKLAELAEWDEEALSDALDELAALDVSLDGLGWDEEELSSLTSAVSLVIAPTDEIPEIQEVAHSEPGGIYQLGPHRLVCGDSTSPEAWGLVDGLLNGRGADCVWTDPPYGVSFVSPGRTTKIHSVIENDSLNIPELTEFLNSALGEMYKRTRAGGVWYVAAPSGDMLQAFSIAIGALPGMFRHGITWVKDRFVFGRSDRHYRHEFIFYGWKIGAAHVWTGGRKRDSVIEIPRPTRSDEHPTMKPVALVEECLICHKPDDGSVPLVLDPFGGSGTTLMASESLGYHAILIELMPKYCDVIRRRWTHWARENDVDPGTGSLD